MATKKKVEPERKICVKCKKDRPISLHFYRSDSPMFDGTVPICKECLRKLFDTSDLQSVKNVLRQIDKPFISLVWNKAVESEKDTFGEYMKIISSLPQYKGLTYENSVEDYHSVNHIDTVDDNEENAEIDVDFELTPQIYLKWGKAYKKEDYMRLENLYLRMIETHDISAPQHKELLKLMCKLNLKMEICLENNDYNGFSKLHDQYQKLLASSGFRPIDRKSGDETTGLRTFSQIFEEVEKDGFIEPWDVDVTQDIVDRSLMYLINYQKKLLHQEILSKPPLDAPKVSDE